MVSGIRTRKDEHLNLCLEHNVQGSRTTGLEDFYLEYDALPELDLNEVQVGIKLFGKALSAPLFIAPITGGGTQGKIINERLALAAQACQLGMAVGSQRIMLEQDELLSHFMVKEYAPNIPLVIGNVGAVQLKHGVTVKQLKTALQLIGADALAFHLNPLQEALQLEGDTDFSGLLERMADVVPQVELPVLVKEVGTGISAKTAKKLALLPIAGVDVAGLGGTNWAMIEAMRSAHGGLNAVAGQHLSALGVPTAHSIRFCRTVFQDRIVVASGGIRTGLEVAKALALGADCVSIALPVLQAVDMGVEQLIKFLETIIHELRLVLFCTGSRSVQALRHVRLFTQNGQWLTY